MRQNILTDRWVIYAPGRVNPVRRMRGERTPTARWAEQDADCPFCLGHEQMLRAILFELPASSGTLWQTRVVSNEHPVVTPEMDVTAANNGIHPVAGNYGRHEVIIESPFHNRDISIMTPREVEAVVETYLRRYGRLYSADENIESIIIFRDHGRQAGASILHPHSQLIATAAVPPSVAHREHLAEVYFERNRRCILCDMLDFEQSQGERLVYENTSFLSFVPFAAEAPFEIWIMPRRHSPDFGLISRQEASDLAMALQDALQRLHDALHDPDYNYIVHSYSRQESIVPHLHWYLQIRPRLTTPAGFEIGSGMQVNPSLPEHDAEILREE